MNGCVLPPLVTPDMLNPDFWLARAAGADNVLLSPGEMATFNAAVHTRLGIPPVVDLPDSLPRDEIEAHMRAYLPSHPLYGVSGTLLAPAWFENLLHEARFNGVRFGLAIRRTDVRAFPTAALCLRDPFAFALDRIQETTIDVGWPVAPVAEDASGHWVFCLTPHYWGWVRAEHIALGSREAVSEYVNTEPFVTVTASRALVALPTDGGITPQMGTRLPLEDSVDSVCRVSIPRRASDGRLSFAEGITRDVTPGYRPCTRRTVFEQAFMLLGEPYAWGGSRLGIFGRDCSRFVRDSYAVTGIRLPRNGSQQAVVCAEQAAFDPDMPDAARKAALIERVSPGAILVLPGHVMVYLGHCDGEPYVIHDTSSGGYSNVIVSDLSLGPGNSLLRRLTQAVTIDTNR